MKHQIISIKALRPIKGYVLEIITVKRDHSKGMKARYTFRLRGEKEAIGNGSFAKKMFLTETGAKKTGMEQIKAINN